MASYPVNPFVNYHLPSLFWPAEIATFGSQVTYLVRGNNPYPAYTISVLWKEGAGDEDVSPGRYSHMDIQNADLPQPPASGDIVERNGKQYQVVRAEALIVGYTVVVLQEQGPVL